MFAYCWLLFGSDSYLPGIIASVWSVLRTGTKYDLVVMVTPDISEETRKSISSIGPSVKIYPVDYIEFEVTPLKTQRQRKIYSSWIKKSFTKMNFMHLPYEKVIFIDADIIILESIDHLFDMQTPAISFNSPFIQPYGKLYSPIDRYLEHGEPISISDLELMIKNESILPNLSIVVIEPSSKIFEDYLSTTKAIEPVGIGSHNGSDEQSFMNWIIKSGITCFNIHHRYNYIPFKDGYLHQGDVPRVIHYFSEKPWLSETNKYPDTDMWYQFYSNAVDSSKIPYALKFPFEKSNVSKYMETYGFENPFDVLGQLE